MIVNNLIIVLVSLLGLFIYNSLLISKYELVEDYEIKNSLSDFIIVVLMILSLLSLQTYYLILLLSNWFPLVAAIIISVLTNGFITLLLTVIPFLTINHKHALKIVKIFYIFELLAKVIFTPLAFLYMKLRKLTYREEKEIMTEDEFLDIVELAEEQLGINENESKLIKNVLDFDQMRVLDIYTPRTEVIAIDKRDSLDDVKKLFKSSGFSRLPIYDESLDDIVGIVNFKDLYNEEVETKKDFQKIIVKPLEVTEYMDLNNLLSLLKRHKQHLAIVKDEYGGTIGIVTLEDVLEELVGDIYDEHDKETNNIKQIDENKYHVLGQTYLYELEELLNIEEIENEDYATVNGFVLAHLEKIGEVGDSFTYENLKVTVLKADSKQTKLVEIEVL